MAVPKKPAAGRGNLSLEAGGVYTSAMLFLIMGASGSGKSSCLPGLKQRQPGIDWRDFDDAPIHATNTAERQTVTAYWLSIALANQAKGISTGIAGTVVLGEVLACPAYSPSLTVHATLLDCADLVRIDRIRARDGLAAKAASQDMLCWAAWLRMHAADPQWRQGRRQRPRRPGHALGAMGHLGQGRRAVEGRRSG